MKIKTKIIFLLLLCLIVFYSLLVSLRLLTGQDLYRIKISYDLNSGDYRYKKYIYTIKIEDKIMMSEFSKELRRLNIDIPDERIWKSQSGFSVTPLFSGRYSDGNFIISNNLRHLIFLLEDNKIPDNERISIIKEILVNIKENDMVKLERGYKEILNKNGLDRD
jgi:hypothetical protein